MGVPLQRDMDMIRDLLLEIEGGKTVFQLLDAEQAAILGAEPEQEMSKDEVARIERHLGLLASAGYIVLHRHSGGIWQVGEISWEGCDFLDSIRDPRIWRATKAGATKAGGFSADLLKAVAKGLIKTQLQKHTGVELEY